MIILCGLGVFALGFIPTSTDVSGALFFTGVLVVVIGGIGIVVRSTEILLAVRRWQKRHG